MNPSFILPLLLLSLISLPQNASDQIRSRAIATMSPFLPSLRTPVSSQELKSLELENHQLRSQLDFVYEWLGSEKRFREQMELFRILSAEEGKGKEFITRRSNEMKSLLQKETKAAFARIIYRDPTSWSSSCWIDVGEENNGALGQTIIAKNSPVVLGASLIGIVEFVGKRQSRVRFITDSGLKTAVRAVRGSILDREIASLTKLLLDRLKKHPDLKFGPIEEGLQMLEKELPIRWEDSYFAKGEVFGASAPYYRSLDATLKGVGFSCDFKDVEGPARDLRSEIICAGDVLVTSGLDGVFPPGLKVAIVTKVAPLKSGDFAYQLEASPMAGDLTELSSLYVLPPMSIE
ncbi:MAG TPA: rod shape-determining protein MreC [Chlamydiales bacterium]|nr:rod shape-determining protein MreC [Chlamydiales bacterium]